MSEKKQVAAFRPVKSLFGDDTSSAAVEKINHKAPLHELHPFKDHPFQVRDDESMQELTESIKANDILVPLIVRERSEGGYEIIAGHRRKHAARLAGLDKVPIDIRDVDDDTAVLMMVNTNVQREKVLPSERAFAYKMMLEAIKRQGERSDLTCGQVGHKLEAKKSIDVIAENTGISRKQIQRYVRLTHLANALLALVDRGKIPFNAGVELSYLRPNEQDDVFNIMSKNPTKPTITQATRLKEESIIHELSKEDIQSILLAEKPAEKRIRFPAELFSTYFDGYTYHEAEKVILTLLDNWKQSRG